MTSMTRSEYKAFAVAAVGGALEFYDFIIYVFFANVIGKLFFDTASELSQLLFALNVYASGYVARLVGGIIFSHFGDKWGRKNNLAATIFMMAIPTLLIAFLPTYNHVGVWAAVLLVICRILQGFSLGGELPCSITFVYEHALKEHRSIAIGILFCGVTMGVFLGSLTGALITNLLRPDQVLDWGWRLAFFLGGLIGFVGIYLRRSLSETPAFHRYHKFAQNQVPLKRVLKDFKFNVFRTIFSSLVPAVGIAVSYLYLPVYMQTFHKVSGSYILILNTSFVFIFAMLIPFFSKLCDTYSERRIMFFGFASLAVMTIPCFMNIDPLDSRTLFFYYAVNTLLNSAITGASVVYLAKSFPTTVRYTGVSLSYNIAFGLIGGFTPLICTNLIKYLNVLWAPGLYLALVASLGIIANIKPIAEPDEDTIV